MKKFIAKITCLLAIFAALDFSVGVSVRFIQSHAIGGDTGRLNIIVDSLTADLLIFGSSRACHHYDPRIIRDSLGLSCYNVGRDGNGIIYNYGQYRLLSNRYVPKVIIYDIQPNFDLLKDRNNTKYLGWLKRYYDRPGIDSIFWMVEPAMRCKMLSQMYRYNSDFIQMASDCVNPLQSDIEGYRPLEGVMQYEPKIPQAESVYEYDDLKFYYWRHFIADCKSAGTQLVFMVSPLYKACDENVFLPIRTLAEEEGIPFVSHYTNPDLSLRREYFKDSSHMNATGATIYTRSIIREIATRCVERSPLHVLTTTPAFDTSLLTE